MVNKIKKDVLLAVVAEWLEEWEVPSLVSRNQYPIEPENLHHILAIVGPRRSGKTYFMFQLIKSLLQSGRYSKEDIVTHDLNTVECTVVRGSEEVVYHLENIGFNVAATFLDETQFFDSGIIEAIEHILRHGVDVIYAALSSTSEGRPFPFSDRKKHVGDLLALPHEDIVVLKAVCTGCGEDAVFTCYVGSEEKTSVIKVGGSESYTALCRDCYYKMFDSDEGRTDKK